MATVINAPLAFNGTTWDRQRGDANGLSDVLPVQIRLYPVLLMLPAVAGCAGATPIVATPSACSALLPPEWHAPVPGAPLPEGSSVADWVSFADLQTGQLDKANDRTLAAIGIVERCEARDQVAVKAARRRKWF